MVKRAQFYRMISWSKEWRMVRYLLMVSEMLSDSPRRRTVNQYSNEYYLPLYYVLRASYGSGFQQLYWQHWTRHWSNHCMLLQSYESSTAFSYNLVLFYCTAHIVTLRRETKNSTKQHNESLWNNSVSSVLYKLGLTINDVPLHYISVYQRLFKLFSRKLKDCVVKLHKENMLHLRGRS